MKNVSEKGNVKMASALVLAGVNYKQQCWVLVKEMNLNHFGVQVSVLVLMTVRVLDGVELLDIVLVTTNATTLNAQSTNTKMHRFLVLAS